jgi:glycosyltransferase involved in cell wall biosynthesis
MLVRCLLAARQGNFEGGKGGLAWQALKGIQLGLQLRSTDATVVHATFAAAAATVGLFASIVAGLPLSIEVHSPAAAVANPRLLAIKLRAAALTVVISRYAGQMVRDLAPEVESQIVHCGLDLDGPISQREDGHAASNRVFCVGSLQPKKGHKILIQASALLAESLPHSVAIAGEGPDRDGLEAEILRLSAPVELLGEIPPDQVARLRRQSSVGVLASVRATGGNEDGIPVALMEFMADGVPVVGTDVAGIGELLKQGEAGAVAESGSARSLAHALQVALTDRDWRDQRIASARKVIEEEFSNELETLRLLGLFAKLEIDCFEGDR